MCTYMDVHSIIIHNSQNTEPKCPSIDELINIMQHSHTREYYWAIVKTNQILIHANMDEPSKHYAEQKRPVTEDKILYDSIYIKCSE